MFVVKIVGYRSNSQLDLAGRRNRQSFNYALVTVKCQTTIQLSLQH